MTGLSWSQFGQRATGDHHLRRAVYSGNPTLQRLERAAEFAQRVARGRGQND